MGTQLPIILQAKKIKKAFYQPVEVEVLKEINLTVCAGDTVAIMGRSGEGKSTLLQILGTLDNPTSGNLEIDGAPVTAFNKSMLRNKKFGFIFQSFHLLEDYTAIENVLMPARIGRQPAQKGTVVHERACNLLKEVGLHKRLHFNTKLLSGGEKQRVSIARALCNDPDIILADEPSGNLDRQTAKDIHELLLRFVGQFNKTLIVVTHDIELAKLCKYQYRMMDGKLELITRP